MTALGSERDAVSADSTSDSPKWPVIGISSAQLRRIPEVIAIAYGADKVSAAHAALRGGYLQSIVTHTAFAERLLAAADAVRPRRAGPRSG